MLLVLLVSLSLACGGGSDAGTVSGGGGGGGGGGGTGVTGSFTADQPNLGADSAGLLQAATAGDMVTISVNVTDVQGISGAQFEIDFDGSAVRYVNWSPGSLFEQGGHSPTYVVDRVNNNLVVVGVSRNGNVPPVDAVGTREMVRLTFRVVDMGSFPLTFQAQPSLTDNQIPPQDLPGISWFAGSLIGR